MKLAQAGTRVTRRWIVQLTLSSTDHSGVPTRHLPMQPAPTLIVISTPASALQPVAAEAWTGHIPPLSWRHQPVYLVVATSIVTNYE